MWKRRSRGTRCSSKAWKCEPIDRIASERRRESSQRGPRVPCHQEKLSQVEQSFCLMHGSRSTFKCLPGVTGCCVVILRGRSGNHQLLMRDCNAVGSNSIQLEHRTESTSSFRKISTELCENAEADPSATLQLGKALLRPKSIDFFIVSAGRTEITKMSRQSPLLRDDSAPQ